MNGSLMLCLRIRITFQKICRFSWQSPNSLKTIYQTTHQSIKCVWVTCMTMSIDGSDHIIYPNNEFSCQKGGNLFNHLFSVHLTSHKLKCTHDTFYNLNQNRISCNSFRIYIDSCAVCAKFKRLSFGAQCTQHMHLVNHFKVELIKMLSQH